MNAMLATGNPDAMRQTEENENAREKKISQALVVAVTVSAIKENVAHLYDHCSISSICKSESLVAPLFIAPAQSMKINNRSCLGITRTPSHGHE